MKSNTEILDSDLSDQIKNIVTSTNHSCITNFETPKAI